MTPIGAERISAKKLRIHSSRFLLPTGPLRPRKGPKRRIDAEPLGLAQQVVKLACGLLSAAAPTMCSNDAPVADEEIGPG
jgi:hypothetical protein